MTGFALVDQWVSEAENKRSLAEALLSKCYRTGEDIVSDGAGCDCQPHKAYRTSAAEVSAEARLKREMQVVHELALAQDSLREMSYRAKAAEDAKVAANDERDAANRFAAAQQSAADNARAELAAARQTVCDRENRLAEYVDQEAYLHSVLAKLDAVRQLLD